MAKQPRTKMSGKEARYIIKENRINMAWLAEQLGITPQTLNSRLNAQEFRRSSMMEINAVLGKDIFGIEDWHKVCYYTARKSFVQHGFDLGISLEVLEYCIGQSMKANRPIFNYVRIMSQHADVAIRQIIDALHEKAGASHE